MKTINVLIKPVSSMCNIHCTYCFYLEVSEGRETKNFGKMTNGVMEQMIDHLFLDLEDGDQLSIGFQGGEPTLAGLSYYKNFVSYISSQSKKVAISYSIQTNGLRLDQQWCTFFLEHDFLVGLSIDGPKEVHDRYRIDTKGKSTYSKVLQGKQLLDDYKIPYNVLCVLTTELASQPEAFYRFLQEEQVEYVQLIPCLPPEQSTGSINELSILTPERFADFYSGVFVEWIDELRQGHYRSIKLFDDLTQLFVFQQPTACGILGNCQMQYVIEADGSVYPCDFYATDDYYVGSIIEKGLRELFESVNCQKFLTEKPQVEETCSLCPYFNACGGGCKRMKEIVYTDKNGFCGYRLLIDNFLPSLPLILQRLEMIR